jgi:hypothetical protein
MMRRCDLNRREFIGSALAAPVILALRPPSAIAETKPCRRTFYDGRFDRAHMLARRLSNGGPLESVYGDATDIALWLRAELARGAAPRIQGITTESVPFCLSHFNPHLTLRSQRIDRDLFVWAF